MKIRRAINDDLEAVNSLLRQVLKVHHTGRPDLFRAEGKKYSDRELLEIFSNPDTPVFVYEEDGNVLGYAFICIMNTLVAYFSATGTTESVAKDLRAD